MASPKKNKETKKSKPVKQVAEKNSNSWLLPGICVAAITLITYFVLSPSLSNGFINWDDPDYVINNPLVATNSIPVVKIFETPVSLHYHPLTILSLALNYQDTKLDPFSYHLENMILHLLNTILVFIFIFLLTRRNLLMASVVSLFFGIHPMHVESVAWISARKDVLYVFFFVAGLITYLRYTDTKKVAWYFFTLLLFILSCLAKELAVVFPGILLLIDYLKNSKWTTRLFTEKIPFILIAAILVIIEIKIQQSGHGLNVMKSYTVFQRSLFASYGAIMYMIRTIAPFNLSLYHPYPKTGLGSLPLIYYLSPVLLLGTLAGIIYLFLKKEKEIVFGLLFFFVSIVLILQFFSFGYAIMADRYSYVSYIGLLFALAYLINKIMQSKTGTLALMKKPVILITVLGAVIFCCQSYAHAQVWKDSDVLWTEVIDTYPHAAMAYYNRGNYYYVNNEADKALSDYNTALHEDSLYRDAYYNRGVLYANFYAKNDLAIADYNKTIKIDSSFASAYNSRGLVYARLNNNDQALADYTKSIKLDPTVSIGYSDRATLYYNTGKVALALIDFNKAIAVDSTDASAYNGAGTCYFMLKNYKDAVTDYSKAIQVNPTDASYWRNRALAENKMGYSESAKADALRAQQLQGK